MLKETDGIFMADPYQVNSRWLQEYNGRRQTPGPTGPTSPWIEHNFNGDNVWRLSTTQSQTRARAQSHGQSEQIAIANGRKRSNGGKKAPTAAKVKKSKSAPVACRRKTTTSSTGSSTGRKREKSSKTTRRNVISNSKGRQTNQ